MAIQKTIEIDGKGVNFAVSASTPRRYREKFGKDLFKDLQGYTAENAGNIDTSVIENLAYIMAKQADPDGVPDSVIDWLDNFAMFSLLKCAPEFFYMWAENAETLETAKKNSDRQSDR